MFDWKRRLSNGIKRYTFNAGKTPPQRIYVEITGACNLRCPNCARTYSENKRGNMLDDLFFKVISSIANDYPKLRRLGFHFFGEIEIKKNFDALIRFAREKLPYTHFGISTTLTHKDKEAIRRLLLAGLNTIGIWPDSCSGDSYAKIRTNGSFETVKENIHFLLTEREKRQLDDIGIHIGMVRNKVNKFHIEEFYHEFKFVENFKNAYLVSSDSHDWAGQIPSDNIIVTAKRYTLKIPKPCFMPFTTLVVSATGDVTLCCYDMNLRLKIGNMKGDAGIKKLWTSPEANSIRNRIRFLNPPELCRQCHNYYFKSPGMLIKAKRELSNKLLTKMRANNQIAQATLINFSP